MGIPAAAKSPMTGFGLKERWRDADTCQAVGKEGVPAEGTRMRFRRMSQSLLFPAGLVWAAAVVFGSTRLLNYEFMPGAAGTPAHSWPADPPSLQGVPDRRPNRRVSAERVKAHLV